MGLANLVPGISGGTMIVVMGLYDEFIGSIADLAKLRLSKRSIYFLGLVGGTAAVAIVSLAGSVSRLVVDHRSAMYSLFIGLTLGGAPTIWKMLGKVSRPAIAGMAIGLGCMVAIALFQPDKTDKDAIREAVRQGQLSISASYGVDALAGALGMSAMVLPGLSGAYMLLILGRYETIFAAVDGAKHWAISFGKEGDPSVFLPVLIPTAIGALLSLLLLSNFLKWMLRAHRSVSLGFIMGLLLGSVVGIWPFHANSVAAEVYVGVALMVAGCATTIALSRIQA